MQSIRIVLVVFALVVTGSGQVLAQQQSRIADRDELNTAVVNRADAVEQDRARLRGLLARPEVRNVARAHGFDLARAQGAANTLGSAELQQLSPLVQGITSQIDSGGAITITTTTLIIILLIVILLVLIT